MPATSQVIANMLWEAATRRAIFTTSAFLFAVGPLSALPTAPLAAQAAVVRRNAATLPFEGGLIVIDAHSDGQVVIGASVGDSTIATPLPAAQAKLWADSTARLLARRVPRTVKSRSYGSNVVNRETSAGISFTRRIIAGKSSYRLFFGNTSYGGFPLDVNRSEADQFVKSLRSAIKMVGELSRPPRPKKR